jgi:DNA (cytosine-5)-methyltransferase 1
MDTQSDDTHAGLTKSGNKVGQTVLVDSQTVTRRTDTVSQIFTSLRARHSQVQLAEKLKVSGKTIGRWERGDTPFPPYLEPALRAIADEHSSTADIASEFSTVDLFAGIGGIRTGFALHGGTCVFTSEWNEFSKKTYLENFPDTHTFVGDIVPFDAEDVPDHDVLLAGFPCQPFSIAGVSKKISLGRLHGFEDITQGTLFFDVARIIKKKRPAAFMLENVKNLVSHDKGNTFRVIIETLRDVLGYEVHYKVIDGGHFTPQHRERIIIVGFAEPTGFSWADLNLPESRPVLSSILHRTDGTEPFIEHDGNRFFDHDEVTVPAKYTLTPNLWAYLQAYAAKHKAAGNGFGFGLVTPNSVTRTLSARYHKDGSEILLSQGTDQRPRRLTPRECARLMGYPDSFRIPVSDTQAYRQFGNSVVVPVMAEVARIMKPHVSAVKALRAVSNERLRG